MLALIEVILVIFRLYTWLIIISAILSWLVAFNILNSRSRLVVLILDFFYRITEPVLRPIRRFLPNLGGVDVSPIVLLLFIFFLERVIILYVYPAVAEMGI